MSKHDEEYNRLLRTVLNNGVRKENRTGIDTISVFGEQAKFDLQEGFPLLTTKKVFYKGIIHELLWFISGSTNIKYLVDNKVNIWNEWAYEKYKKQVNDPLSFEDFINKLRELDKDSEFVEEYGDLGEGTYGGMWRNFPYHYSEDEVYYNIDVVEEVSTGTVDQLSDVIYKLKNKPDDRRIIVSAWHPYWVNNCALPPCHCLFHFNTEPIKGSNKRKLNCLLYQRSCDLFLGVPFNITSYSLLTHMIAQVCDMEPGVFTHTYGDLHIYKNHLEQVNEQLSREPYKAPTLKLNQDVKNLFDFKYEDISITNYQCHPAIKGEVAV